MAKFCGITWYKLNYHDIQACIEIICFILGIGSLGVPYAIAQAGPVYGFLSFFIMIALNIYTSVLLSKCFLNVPSTITTFPDLGEYIFPKFGRPLVQFTQFTTCFLVPIAFFILAGSDLVPHIVTFQSITPTMWICLLYVCILPIICIRNLKEAFVVMLIGALTAFFADFLAVLTSYTSSDMILQNVYEPSEVKIFNVFSVFGTFALAYATALILPTIQRGHPEPERMPMNIMIGMGLVSIVYLLIAVLGYMKFGCAAPKNLLFMMTESVWKRIAFFSMLVHVLIALSMVSSPVFYYFEELLFSYQRSRKEKNLFKNVYDIRSTSGMNRIFSVNSQSCKSNVFVSMNGANSVVRTPNTLDLEDCNSSKFSTLCPIERRLTSKEKLESIVLRLTLTAIQAFLGILGQEAFSEIADFIGATSIASSCLIIPCIFYMKLFSHQQTRRMRLLCIFIVVFTAICGLYTASTKLNAISETLKDYQLFGNKVDVSHLDVRVGKPYPLCPKGYAERHKEL